MFNKRVRKKSSKEQGTIIGNNGIKKRGKKQCIKVARNYAVTLAKSSMSKAGNYAGKVAKNKAKKNAKNSKEHSKKV